MKVSTCRYQWQKEIYSPKLTKYYGGKMYIFSFYKFGIIFDFREEPKIEFCESYEMKRQAEYCKEICDYCKQQLTNIKNKN